MSKYFETIREPVTITARGKTHEFFIRELGFNRFIEITRTAGQGLDDSARGLAVVQALVLASVEEADGTKSYTQEDWDDEIKEVVDQISKAVMKVQGIDMDRAKESKPLSKEEAEGNV